MTAASVSQHLARANELRQLERYDLALQEVQRALALEPESSAPHTCAAWIMRAQKRFSDAEQAARSALAANPNDHNAHHILAIVLWEQRRHAEARQSFEAALTLVGGHSALYLTNYARMMTNHHTYPDALSALALANRALAIAPTFADPHEIRGLALRQLGRDTEAEYRAVHDRIKAAIAQRPADTQLYEQLADAQQALGDAAGAVTSLGVATALRGAPPAPEPAAPHPSSPAPDQGAPIPLAEWLAGAGDPLDPNADLAERPTIAFADVGGMDEVKERIRMAIIYPLHHPDVFAAYGKRSGGGLLLYGPPGCGKTYLARATAGEVRASFFSIGISDVLDMWHGQSEQKLHALFENARRARPAVLFFDEIEAIGGNRLDMRQHFHRTLVNQFLAELDGATSDNEGILIVGATNAPWHVDSALRRPGRFDHIAFVAPPDEPARREILRLHLKGKPAAEDVDVARLARETDGFSGADLRALVDSAAETALQTALRGGQIMPLTTDLLLRALRERRASTAEWLNTAKNYALYSNEGGMYDDVAVYLRKRKLMR